MPSHARCSAVCGAAVAAAFTSGAFVAEEYEGARSAWPDPISVIEPAAAGIASTATAATTPAIGQPFLRKFLPLPAAAVLG